MKVYLGKDKKIVEVELVEKRKHTVLVRLPDGNTIVRKQRQVVQDENSKG